VTGGGARLLAEWLRSPLTDCAAINARLDSVSFFLAGNETLAKRSARCAQILADMPRALSRLALNRGGPRDLAAIREGLEAAEADIARCSETEKLPEELAQAAACLPGAREMAEAGGNAR
jgi:DNA mismatch repair protein MutS